MFVKTKIENQIGHIELNRPGELNALSWGMVEDTLEALDAMEKEDDVKVIILSGEGKSFCSGGDIKSMKDLSENYKIAEWIDFVSSLTKKILNLDKYVIAAVNGYAAGAGFSLALAADFIVADKNAKFALSFTNVGLIPDLGLMRLLVDRVTPVVAKEWISSGRVVSAQEAYEKGIINRIAEESVVEEAVDFAEFIVKGPHLSNKYVKYMINHVREFTNESAFMQENMIQTMLLNSLDHKEGINAFLEKRNPIFLGK